MAFRRALCFSTCAEGSYTSRKSWMHSQRRCRGLWMCSTAWSLQIFFTLVGREASNLSLTLILITAGSLQGGMLRSPVFPPWEESRQHWQCYIQAWLEEWVSYVSVEMTMSPRNAGALCFSTIKSMQVRHVVDLWPNPLFEICVHTSPIILCDVLDYFYWTVGVYQMSKYSDC